MKVFQQHTRHSQQQNNRQHNNGNGPGNSDPFRFNRVFYFAINNFLLAAWRL